MKVQMRGKTVSVSKGSIKAQPVSTNEWLRISGEKKQVGVDSQTVNRHEG